MRTKKLVQKLGEVSEAFVLADAADSDEVAALHAQLAELAGLAGAAKDAECQAAAAAAADALAHTLREAPDRLVPALESVGATLRELQGMVSGRPPAAVPARTKQCVEEAVSSEQTASAVVGDDEILQEFIERQSSFLEQIDTALAHLAERAQRRAAAATLHRLLHTLKGDCGLLDLPAMARMCAASCVALERGPAYAYIEELHALRHWLAEATAALRQGAAYAPDETLMAGFAREVRAAVEGPEPVELVKEAEPAESQPAESVAPAPASPAAAGEEAADSEPWQEAPAAAETENGYEIREVDLVKDFIAEATEHLESADQQLLCLENDPTKVEALDTVFRSFHTIKGMAGFLGLPPIMDLAHECETLLDVVKKGRQHFEGRAVQATFGAVDMLRALTRDLAHDVGSGNLFFCRENVGGLIREIRTVLGADPAHEGGPGRGGGLVVDTAGARGTDSVARQWLRVDAEKIDALLNTIGELVIAESVVAGDPALASLKTQGLDKNLTHLTKITRSLQGMATSMRMIPIEGMFRRMSRLVRDLAKKQNKRIHLAVEGAETELDRNMIERLSDPLLHLLRNAVDHGIEPSEAARRAAGKSPEGRLWLRAYHRGGNVHIEVRDDGRGLDPAAIAAGAVKRGVLAEEHGLSDRELLGLIFEPGFSTAETVTSVSGRGVGMDVVKRSVESLRGNVLVDSKPGVGTTFGLVLPLTMAIIDGMAAEVGEETYVVPLLSIVECVRPTPDMLSSVLDRGELISFRDALLPLFRLSGLFESRSAIADPCEAIVMVVEDGGRRAGLLVDSLLGQQQTVIKSLGDGLGQTPGISGASIMADGRPGLILDVPGLVKLATNGHRRERVSERRTGGGVRASAATAAAAPQQ